MKISKVWIGSLDMGATGGEKGRGGLAVEAQYNPATLEISQNVPWKKPDAATKGPDSKPAGRDANDHTLEFSGAEGRSLSLELMFDAVESGESIKPQVDILEELAAVRTPGGKEDERRPHHCLVVWQNVLPKFKCVIESLTTKYTMFANNGTPLRATCTVKLKEAEKVQRAKEKKA